MTSWNLWHGCRKISEGCRHCYVYRQDALWAQDASLIRKTAAFDLPVRRDRTGRYRIAPGETIHTCFTSDFFIDEADAWREEAWSMIRRRRDCTFVIFTKRIGRVAACLPEDWGDGWPHVVLCCTCENQKRADERLPVYLDLPLRRREVICAPLLGPIDLQRYLASGGIDLVTCGGESGNDARVCDYAWVTALQEQCKSAGVAFSFHQTGARLRKEGRIYRIRREFQHVQAHKAGIDLLPPAEYPSLYTEAELFEQESFHQ